MGYFNSSPGSRLKYKNYNNKSNNVFEHLKNEIINMKPGKSALAK
jgi:hypothetical protein